MNTVQLIGRLTKDPELKYSPSGTPIARFTIAVNNEFKKDEADFINCVAFNKQAENLCNYQKKGSRIGVVGRIQTGSYEGQDGKRVYTTDVIANNIEYLDSKNQGESQSSNQQQNYNRTDEDPFANNKGPIEVSEEDLPF